MTEGGYPDVTYTPPAEDILPILSIARNVEQVLEKKRRVEL